MKLIIFPTPLDAQCVLTHDSGWAIAGVPDTHPTGRPGQSFTIPPNTPNGWGARLTMGAAGKVGLNQKGILWLNDGMIYPWTPGQEAAFAADDFTLADLPAPIVIPCPDPEPNADPFTLIRGVYATGKHELLTKAGCGKFTEACCVELHNRHSLKWGHLRKSGAQNQYNGHAVDAVQLLVDVGDFKAGIYDIIISSESPDAKPACNWADPPNPSQWYYPA